MSQKDNTIEYLEELVRNQASRMMILQSRSDRYEKKAAAANQALAALRVDYQALYLENSVNVVTLAADESRTRAVTMLQDRLDVIYSVARLGH